MKTRVNGGGSRDVEALSKRGRADGRRHWSNSRAFHVRGVRSEAGSMHDGELCNCHCLTLPVVHPFGLENLSEGGYSVVVSRQRRSHTSSISRLELVRRRNSDDGFPPCRHRCRLRYFRIFLTSLRPLVRSTLSGTAMKPESVIDHMAHASRQGAGCH